MGNLNIVFQTKRYAECLRNGRLDVGLNSASRSSWAGEVAWVRSLAELSFRRCQSGQNGGKAVRWALCFQTILQPDYDIICATKYGRLARLVPSEVMFFVQNSSPGGSHLCRLSHGQIGCGRRPPLQVSRSARSRPRPYDPVHRAPSSNAVAAHP